MTLIIIFNWMRVQLRKRHSPIHCNTWQLIVVIMHVYDTLYMFHLILYILWYSVLINSIRKSDLYGISIKNFKLLLGICAHRAKWLITYSYILLEARRKLKNLFHLVRCLFSFAHAVPFFFTKSQSFQNCNNLRIVL